MSELRDALAKVIDRELQTRGCDIDGLAFIGFASDARAFLARFGEELLRAEGDAGRYRWLRDQVCANSDGFAFVKMPNLPANWRNGSILQHLDAAIDAALRAGDGGR